MTIRSSKTVAEREFPYAMTSAEIEVAKIFRLAQMQTFSMRIEHRDCASAARLTDIAAGKLIEGHGPTFEAAWRSLSGADSDGLGLWEGIEARGKTTGGHLTLAEAYR